jgi:hypothetical protein
MLAIAIHLPAVRATAQTTTGGSTGTTALAESDFSIYVQVKSASGGWTQLSTSDAKTYFDRARCNCGSTVRFVVEVETSTAMSNITSLLAASGADGEARLYLGQSSGCTSDPTDTSYGCVLLDSVDELSSLAKNGYWTSAETSVTDLFGGADACDVLKTQYIWLWIDTASDGSADLTGDSAPSLNLRLDGKAPSPPSGLSVQGGKQALILTWTASATSSSSSSDLAGYFVFCMRSQGTAAWASSPSNDHYVSPATLAASSLCPNQDMLTASTFAATLSNLDPAYLCSGLIAADQTSYRLKSLENDVAYTLVMATVDNDGNLSAPTDSATGTPVLTVDFYNEYVNEGGQAVGGYCTVAKGAARPGGLTCLLFAAAILPLALRRAKSRRHPCLIPLVAVLGARPAFGQAIFHDESSAGLGFAESAELADSPDGRHHAHSPRSMAMEFRLGPYLPDVDAGLANGATPHQAVFGQSTHLLYQLEVDYELWQGFGTLALGAGLGYFRETAKAFVAGADGTSTTVRSSDETALRLLPVSLLVIYRMDVLAERWQIPLVPYAKIGLNYTLWKITDGNGDQATLLQGGRGAGGTAGWQLAGGVALQLDVLDAASMRELDGDTGINHVYAFVDYAHVDASGLGMGKRLHVGDNTWSVGFLVEF